MGRRKKASNIDGAVPPPSSNNCGFKQYQSHHHFVETYLAPWQIEFVLESKKEQILHWAYIVHNRDVKDDGTVKECHKHIVLYTLNSRRGSDIRNWFADPVGGQNTNTQKAVSLKKCFEYLMHINDPNKTQYNRDEVRCDNSQYWDELADDEAFANSLYEAVDAYTKGVSTRELCRTYGRDFIIHSGTVVNLANQICLEEQTTNHVSELLTLEKSLEARVSELANQCAVMQKYLDMAEFIQRVEKDNRR